MDFEDKKENIQPLRTGRNVELLEQAFESPESWEACRKLHEQEVEMYAGDDPLQPWYDYMSWMEQTNVSSGKPMLLENAVRRCVQKFENDQRYMQDHRFIKLCIKYIDSQPSPVELYNELYNRGVGTLCSELYIAWAYYYDAVDNFAKTEEVFQKGIRAGAEPKADLDQAHKTFGFSMSQRMLYKDEHSQKKFQYSLDERRNALTSLRATQKKNVGSVRTGLAVKDYRPGVVNQENRPHNGPARNPVSNAVIFSDEGAGSSGDPNSIVRPFSSVHNEAENIIESARLTKAQGSHKKGPLFASHLVPSFDIPVDEEPLQPIPLIVENYSRGIQLPTGFCCKNKPQTPFEVSICVGDPNEWAIPMYDKIRLYCRAGESREAGEKTEYSPEELRAYRYFMRNGVDNKFTAEHAQIWANRFEVGIRLHPLHVRESKCKDMPKEKGKDLLPHDVPGSEVQTKVREMYADPADEKSVEELLMVKWQEGKIKRCVDRRYHDDIDPVDMDETHVESKRVSMGGARFSLAPASMGVDRTQMRQRRSIFPAGGQPVALIAEETEEELRNRSSVQAGRSIEQTLPSSAPTTSADADTRPDAIEEAVSRKRLSDDILVQAAPKKEDTKSTPLKSILGAEKERNAATGNIMSPEPLPATVEKVQIFVDDSDENDEREELLFPKPSSIAGAEQPYYPNDTCSTQVFNMFLKHKNISTPVGAVRKQPPVSSASSTTNTAAMSMKRLVVFADDDDEDDDAECDGNKGRKTASRQDMVDDQQEPCRAPTAAVDVPTMEAAKVNDENAPPTVDSCTPPSTSTSTSSGCNSTQSHKQLSTIMERTETSATSGSAVTGATKSSVDTQVLSPEPTVLSAGEETNLPSAPPKPSTVVLAPKESFFKLPLPSDEPKGFGIHIDSTETMANVPLLIKRDLPPVLVDDKENECVLRAATASAASTSVRKNAQPSVAASAGIFQLPDEPTYTGVTAGPGNLSHMVQREMNANSIVSFRMTTERTNTVPLMLVKQQATLIPPEVALPGASPSVATDQGSTMVGIPERQAVASSPVKTNNLSLLDQLDATFSPKVVTQKPDPGVVAESAKSKESSFNLTDLMKPAHPLESADGAGLQDREPLSVHCPNLSMLPVPSIKMEPSLNLDASLELPKFTVPTVALPAVAEELEKDKPVVAAAAVGSAGSSVAKVVLDEFLSPLAPPKRNGSGSSFDDINTMAFSLNINHVINSTIIQPDFDSYKTPRKQQPFPTGLQGPQGTTSAPLNTLTIAEVKSGITNHPSLLLPAPEAAPEVIDLSEATSPTIPLVSMLPPLPSMQLSNATTATRRVSPFQTDEIAFDGEMSIYHPRPTVSQEDEERWEEIDDQFDPHVDNEYQHKTPIDPECTMQQINAYVGTADEVDPFDKQLLGAFLDRLDFMNYIAELSNCTLMNKLQPIKKGTRLALHGGGDTYQVLQKIGKGAYGTVFCGQQASTGQTVALKQERPANLWEYYICLEIRSRITNPEILHGFMRIDHAFVGNNASIFVSKYSRYGNILDVCNLINKATNRNVDEFIAMIISAQILSIVDHLHSCQIIHADIKPDNFLLMSPINMDDKVPCVQLIDFGESIDMQLFEKDVKFKRVITTDGFTCIEMREGRPWTFQPDLFGVAGTSHAILFGRYMQVQKNIVNWGIKASMPRYFKKAVWENYFTALLNIRDCEHLPNLQNLRTAFLEEISLHEKYIRSKISEFNQTLASFK